jgi:hypothetical protein
VGLQIILLVMNILVWLAIGAVVALIVLSSTLKVPQAAQASYPQSSARASRGSPKRGTSLWACKPSC